MPVVASAGSMGRGAASTAGPMTIPNRLSVLGRMAVFLAGRSVATLLLPFRLLAANSRAKALEHELHESVRAGYRLYGFDSAMVGTPPSADDGPLLVVANHRTGMDTAVIENLVNARSLSKDRVSRWPLFGRLARARGTVFLNKEGAGSRVSAVRSIGAALDGGASVIVFPEGVIEPGDEVRPFHRGAFAAARGRQVVCIGLAYPPSFEWLKKEPMPVHLWSLLWRGRIPVGVAIGEPFVVPPQSREAAREAHRRTSALVVVARDALNAREGGPHEG